METPTQFIPQALRVISDAVVAVIGMTDLHVRTTPLSKRLASRARARLIALEKMLRRVIILMALAMAGEVRSIPKMLARIRRVGFLPTAPVRPRARRAPKTPAPRLPSHRCAGPGDFDFSSLPRRARSGPVPIRRLLARIITLQQILANPAPKARRLAFYFDRLKQRRAMPAPSPDIALQRAPAELALVAGALRLEQHKAMAAWHDTS